MISVIRTPGSSSEEDRFGFLFLYFLSGILLRGVQVESWSYVSSEDEDEEGDEELPGLESPSSSRLMNPFSVFLDMFSLLSGSGFLFGSFLTNAEGCCISSKVENL